MGAIAGTGLLAAGALVGAIIAVLVQRKLSEAAIARAIAEAKQQAAAVEGDLKAAAERLRAEVESANTRRAEEASRSHAAEQRIESLMDELRKERGRVASLETAEATYETRLQELSNAQTTLKDAFSALCSDALRNNNEQFLQLARTELEKVNASSETNLKAREVAIEGLLSPIREGLAKYDEKLESIEQERIRSFTSITEQVASVVRANDGLRSATEGLSRALTNTNVRGAWGELQLRRAIELAGMVEHCDFVTQATTESSEGNIRPDVVVNLPGGRQVVIDAKAPANAILEAINCPDDVRRAELCAEHVMQVQRHVGMLSRKAYWDQFPDAPDFVVLFLPAEAFFSIALQTDPGLYERSFEQKVVITTPATLIALLKAVAYGWRQEAMARHAQQIADLGRDLYDRIRTLSEHFDKVGTSLGNAVDAYNKSIGSLERRVLAGARRFSELGVEGTKEIATLTSIDKAPTLITNAELRLPPLPPAGDLEQTQLE